MDRLFAFALYLLLVFGLLASILLIIVFCAAVFVLSFAGVRALLSLQW